MSNESDSIETELAELDAEENKPPAGAVRRFLPIALAVVTLVSFGGVVWYAYSTGIREGSEFAAPTLKPDGPSKVAPRNPGGQQIADQDKLVYGKIDKSGEGRTVERLLPPPENPLPAPVAKKSVAPPPLPTPKLDVPKAPPTSELPPPPSITAPRKTEKSAKNLTQDVASLAAIAPEAGGKAVKEAKAPEPPKTPSPPAAKPKKPLKTALKAPPPRAPQVASKSDPAKGYRIQIGSLRSELAAKLAWRKYVKQHGPVLSKLSLLVKKADLGKKGVYYRVQAGPLQNKEAARRICDELKQKKVGCFVVAP
ncbi:MAG: hypothetical protein GKS00_24465 [Alphaproteobacteria bacterium]|nr:hypothetical protein [Alphaproteobacteria bacterium]